MNLTLPVSGAWRTTAIDLGQWLPGGSADGRNRRVSRVALRLGEGLLAEPTADTQPGLWGLVFMPPSGHCRGKWQRLSRVETRHSRFARNVMPRLESGRSLPEARTPDAALISALPLVGRKAEGYHRRRGVAASLSRGSPHGHSGVATGFGP